MVVVLDMCKGFRIYSFHACQKKTHLPRAQVRLLCDGMSFSQIAAFVIFTIMVGLYCGGHAMDVFSLSCLCVLSFMEKCTSNEKTRIRVYNTDWRSKSEFHFISLLTFCTTCFYVNRCDAITIFLTHYILPENAKHLQNISEPGYDWIQSILSYCLTLGHMVSESTVSSNGNFSLLSEPLFQCKLYTYVNIAEIGSA